MPEGDTLYKIARFIDERARGQQIESATLLGQPTPYLARRALLRVWAHGKHVFFSLSPKGEAGLRLRVHLGMYGSWHHYPEGAAWQRPRSQARVVLQMSNVGAFVCFLAEDAELLQGSESLPLGMGKRRLGQQLINEQRDPPSAPTTSPSHVARVHPAAFDEDIDVILRALLRAKEDMPVVDVLLSQRIAAGFGNVYKSELMFLFQLAPQTRRDAYSLWTWASVFARGRMLLAQNIGGWARTTTVDRTRMRLPQGMPRLWVYNRAGKPCLLCNAPIERAYLGRHRRSTYFCPQCQSPTARGEKSAAETLCAVPWRSHVQIPWQKRRARGPVRGR